MSQPINPYEPPKEIVEKPAMESDETPMRMPIKFAGKNSVQDFQVAVQLLQQEVRKAASGPKFVVIVGYMVLMIIPFFYVVLTQPSIDMFCMVYPSVALMVSVVLFSWLVRQKYKHLCATGKSENELWAEGKGRYTHVEGQVDWQSFEIRTKHSSGTILWTNYCGFRRTDEVVVLYEVFPNNMNIFSREHFQKNEDWGAFVQLVARKLPQI